MELFKLVCPACGADISLEKETNDCFCPYCGTKFKFDDGVKHSEHTIYYRDEARLKELELQEQEQCKAEQRRLKEEKRKNAEEMRELQVKRRWVIILGVWLGLTIVFLLLYNSIGYFFPSFEPTGLIDKILTVIGTLFAFSPVILPVFFPYEYVERGKPFMWVFWTVVLYVVLFVCIEIVHALFT